MSRYFDIKLDKISEFYAVHFKKISDNLLICCEDHTLYEKVIFIQWPELV